MVDDRTTEAMQVMLGLVKQLGANASPRSVQQAMFDQQYSRVDVYRAFQLALSRNVIKIENSMQIKTVAAEAA